PDVRALIRTMARANPLGRTPDPRRAPEARPRDLAGHGLQVPGPPSNAPIADVAHVPRQPHWEPRLKWKGQGHSSIKITVDYYGHLVPTRRRVIVNRLDDETPMATQ